jgi:hypothetical protein
MRDLDQDMQTSARLAGYGVAETNPLWMAGYDHSQVEKTTVKLSDPRLVRVVRLRLNTDDTWTEWEVSYCHGIIRDGGRERLVNVDLMGYDRILKKGRGRRATVDGRDLVRIAQEAKVHAKRIGLFDAVSTVA